MSKKKASIKKPKLNPGKMVVKPPSSSSACSDCLKDDCYKDETIYNALERIGDFDIANSLPHSARGITKCQLMDFWLGNGDRSIFTDQILIAGSSYTVLFQQRHGNKYFPWEDWDQKFIECGGNTGGSGGGGW